VIAEYSRPRSIDEALALLVQPGKRAVPMGGGSALERGGGEPLAVVDLQALGLDTLERRGNSLLLGATLTLQRLLEQPDLPPALEKAIRHECAYNLRQAGTVAGTLVSAGGRSPFAAAFLALDAVLEVKKQAAPDEELSLGELLPVRRERLAGRLVTRITLPLNARLAYEYVARTPADRPIVCAAVARWPSGRTRAVLGGYGSTPVLILDGPEPGGAEAAAEDAYSFAADEWASAEYRKEIAPVLVRRCLELL
jgi:CO/xanthine dehydrogenase FAD-binding subunit